MNNEHLVNLFVVSQRRTQNFRTGGVLTFPEQSLHDYLPPHFYRAPLYLVEKGSYYHFILMLIGKSGRQF